MVNESNNPKSFDECLSLIDKSISGLEITSEFIKLPQVDKVVEYQKELRNRIFIHFRNIIIYELQENHFIPFTVSIWDGNSWEVSVKKVENINPEIKRKWWNFNSKSK